ncbi:hypothetical protein GCM10009743_65760 [Kribbella swartbergensis]
MTAPQRVGSPSAFQTQNASLLPWGVMKVWWEFRCDANHQWTLYADESPDPPDEAMKCPVDGSPAVTATSQTPADRVVIAIVPAARIVDAETGTVGFDSEYHLEISSTDNVRTRRSSRSYDWDEAVGRAALFRRVSWEQALVRWEKIGAERPASP